jgi:hypothetical protein
MTERQFVTPLAGREPESIRLGPTLIAATASPGTDMGVEDVDRDTILGLLMLRNTSGSDVTVTAEITPAGGSATAFLNVVVPANGSAIVRDLELPLDAGDALAIYAGTTNVVTATWSAKRP